MSQGVPCHNLLVSLQYILLVVCTYIYINFIIIWNGWVQAWSKYTCNSKLSSQWLVWRSHTVLNVTVIMRPSTMWLGYCQCSGGRSISIIFSNLRIHLLQSFTFNVVCLTCCYVLWLTDLDKCQLLSTIDLSPTWPSSCSALVSEWNFKMALEMCCSRHSCTRRSYSRSKISLTSSRHLTPTVRRGHQRWTDLYYLRKRHVHED